MEKFLKCEKPALAAKLCKIHYKEEIKTCKFGFIVEAEWLKKIEE